MPSKHPPVLTLRGTDEYSRFLDRLLERVQASGVRCHDRSALADYALVSLGLRHGLRSPRRLYPMGTNRHGPPRGDRGQ